MTDLTIPGSLPCEELRSYPSSKRLEKAKFVLPRKSGKISQLRHNFLGNYAATAKFQCRISCATGIRLPATHHALWKFVLPRCTHAQVTHGHPPSFRRSWTSEYEVHLSMKPALKHCLHNPPLVNGKEYQWSVDRATIERIPVTKRSDTRVSLMVNSPHSPIVAARTTSFTFSFQQADYR